MFKKQLIGALIISSLTFLNCSCDYNNKNDINSDLSENKVVIKDAIGGSLILKNPLQNEVGNKIYLEVKPLEGYYLDDIEISNEERVSFESENLYSFVLKKGDNIVTPIFAQKSKTKDCSLYILQNEYGKVTSNKYEYLAHSTFEFSVTPNDGYKVDSITLNNKDISLNSINTYSVTLLENLNFLYVNFTKDDTPKEKFTIVNELEIITKVVEIDINEDDDPYKSKSKDDFYLNYSNASSYEDAYFRTKHYLMSGDITPQKEESSLMYKLPFEVPTYEDAYLMNSLCRYEVDQYGNYVSYTVNTLDGNDYKIYYGAGYSSLDDVSAYLFAFGDVPANYIKEKKASSYEITSTWGEYLRLNQSRFSGDTSRYPYEPELTGIFGDYNYYESDFGSIGGFDCNGPVSIYNNGNRISRGTCRFVYNFENHDGSKLDLNNRHVFYTYNHYNDFQEYLNYKGGYTPRFGNESAGNPYNQVINGVKPTNPYKIYKANFNFD